MILRAPSLYLEGEQGRDGEEAEVGEGRAHMADNAQPVIEGEGVVHRVHPPPLPPQAEPRLAVAETVATALANLCYDNEWNRMAVRVAGGIPILVGLVSRFADLAIAEQVRKPT